MRTIRAFSFLVALVLLGASAPAQNRWKTLAGESKDGRGAEEFVLKVMAQAGVSGLSVAVVQDGAVVFQRTLGVVDRETRQPVNDNTVFRGASLSKPVFAWLVMKHVEEGRLELDKPLYTYLAKPLPEYPDYRDLGGDERWRKLTARMVLDHTTGFPNWRRMNPSGKLDFKASPGERFGYSGEGYKLLQFVLEQMNGKDLNSIAREKMFEPLGMGQTGFLWETRFDGNFAVELEAGLGPLIKRTRTVANSAGSLLTNAPDYGRFLLTMMEARGLKRQTIETMLKPQVQITSKSLFAPPGTDGGQNRAIQLAWALGWGRFRGVAGEAYFHLGLEEGCQNYAVVYPGRRTGLVILSVQRELKSFTGDVLKELIGDVSSPLGWLGY
jgi:CubicO group peptidase (beta-lactamase class C family)